MAGRCYGVSAHGVCGLLRHRLPTRRLPLFQPADVARLRRHHPPPLRPADCRLPVTAVDEDGLQLSDPLPGGGQVVRLDEVDSATIGAEQQPALDKLLAELGDPLFRLRWRLSVGDVDGLDEPAAAVYPRYRGRRSITALLVATATMRGRIHAGQRESAVDPLLQIVEILRSGTAKPGDLPGERT